MVTSYCQCNAFMADTACRMLDALEAIGVGRYFALNMAVHYLSVHVDVDRPTAMRMLMCLMDVQKCSEGTKACQKCGK